MIFIKIFRKKNWVKNPCRLYFLNLSYCVYQKKAFTFSSFKKHAFIQFSVFVFKFSYKNFQKILTISQKCKTWKSVHFTFLKAEMRKVAKNIMNCFSKIFLYSLINSSFEKYLIFKWRWNPKITIVCNSSFSTATDLRKEQSQINAILI